MDKKRCTGCGEEWDATTEYFPTQVTGRGGLRSRCRACVKREAAAYNRAHRARLRETLRRWRAANPERNRLLRKRNAWKRLKQQLKEIHESR